eukprot:SAG31_NODE_24200_length_486_cov_5.377261_1_plen_104_part_10
MFILTFIDSAAGQAAAQALLELCRIQRNFFDPTNSPIGPCSTKFRLNSIPSKFSTTCQHGPIGELVGSDFFDRGAIVFAAKFRGAAPRRAAPRSMRGDARRADH